jgi:hypothetical protein
MAGGYSPAGVLGGMADPFGGTAATANNGSVWYQWNNYYGTQTTAGTSATNVWPQWNNYYYVHGQGITAIPYDTSWIAWVKWQTSVGMGMGNINAPAYVQPPETEAERIRREERVVQAQAEQKERELKKAVAKTRARNTLHSILSKKQREEFERDGAFLLTVNERLYRIRPGCRVERLDLETKKVKSFFCIHPAHTTDVPHEDWAISQKLLLEADEPAFLKLANETRAAA